MQINLRTTVIKPRCLIFPKNMISLYYTDFNRHPGNNIIITSLIYLIISTKIILYCNYYNNNAP